MRTLETRLSSLQLELQDALDKARALAWIQGVGLGHAGTLETRLTGLQQQGALDETRPLHCSSLKA